MTGLFKFLLAGHVILGLVGIMASYAILLGLLNKRCSIRFLRGASLISFCGYVFSWISGGYYYVQYYGPQVKPRIMEGSYPWAHAVFTETKEHVFLFLPFAALALVALFFLAGDKFGTDDRLRKNTALLAGAVTLAGTFVLLSGIVISGGAR